MTTEKIRLKNLFDHLRSQTGRLEKMQKGIQRKAWWTGGVLGAVGVGVGAYIIWKIFDRYGY